jgi:hypothetical protein
MIINLPYGNNFFDHKALVKKIKSTGRNYIIQGQVACTLADHPKPNSLDVWLRTNYARYPDTKQAVNEVISNLLNTGDFELGTYKCPDSGRK